jgi:hypothetical protein
MCWQFRRAGRRGINFHRHTKTPSTPGSGSGCHAAKRGDFDVDCPPSTAGSPFPTSPFATSDSASLRASGSDERESILMRLEQSKRKKSEMSTGDCGAPYNDDKILRNLFLLSGVWHRRARQSRPRPVNRSTTALPSLARQKHGPASRKVGIGSKASLLSRR